MEGKEQELERRIEPVWQKFIYNQGTLIIAAISLAFGIYFTFANPQRNTDTVLAEVKAEFVKHQAVQVETDNKTANELNAIRTGDLKDTQRQLSDMTVMINTLTVQVAKLETIINERLPAKK
jgi:hypothetical protein